MRRMHRFLVAAAVAAAALGGSAARSFAHGPGFGPPLERAVESLRLDAPTQQRVDAVFDAARPAERELGRTLRAHYETLHKLMGDPAAKEADVLAQAESIGSAQTELRKHELHQLFAVRAVLSPEQRAQLTQALEDMHQRHRRGPAMGGGPR